MTFTVPVRDMDNNMKIAFLLTIFDADPRDFAIISPEGNPLRKRLEKRGIDCDRYQVSIWDLPV